MKVKADIHHVVTTSDVFSSDLDIQWQPLLQCAPAVRLFVYERHGRFAASYSHNETVLRLFDTQSVCMPAMLLPLSSQVLGEMVVCQQLCFSHCSQYLLGCFVSKSRKRLGLCRENSKFVLWHLASKTIVQIINIPFQPNLVQELPSEHTQAPLFLVASSIMAVAILLNAGVSSAAVFAMRPADASILPLACACSMHPVHPPCFDGSPLESTLNIATEKLTDHSILAVLPTIDSDESHAGRFLIVQATLHSHGAQTTLSTFALTRSCEPSADPQWALVELCSPMKLITAKAVSFVVSKDTQRLVLICVDRVLVFESSATTEGSRGSGTWSTSMSIPTGYPLHVIGEFCGLLKNIRITAASFLRRPCVDSTSPPSISVTRSDELLLLSVMQQVDRLTPTGEFVLWNVQGQRKVHNNPQKPLQQAQRSAHVSVLRSSGLIPLDLLVQPEHSVPNVFAIDVERKVWNAVNLFFSGFPGPMFPAGYTVIQQVRPYLEREDELDVIQADDADEDNPIKSLTVVDLNTRMTPKTQDSSFLLPASPANFAELLSALGARHSLSFDTQLSLPTVEDVRQSSRDEDIEDDDAGGGVLDENKDMAFSLLDLLPRKDLFPADTMFIVPQRVRTGDFTSKLERDYSAPLEIDHQSRNKELVRQRLRVMREETVAWEVRQLFHKERIRLRSIEKKQQRDKEIDALLRGAMDIAVQGSLAEQQALRGTEEEHQRMNAVRHVMDTLVDAVVERFGSGHGSPSIPSESAVSESALNREALVLLA